jgi:hypothetical protein
MDNLTKKEQPDRSKINMHREQTSRGLRFQAVQSVEKSPGFPGPISQIATP